MLTFTIPGHPAGKGRPRAAIGSGGHATVYTDARTVTEEWNFLALARPYLPKVPFSGILRLEIIAVLLMPKSSAVKRAAMLAGAIRPTRKPDTDNLAKLVMDAMNGRFYLDDSQVVELLVSKVYGEAPSVTVSLFPLDGIL